MVALTLTGLVRCAKLLVLLPSGVVMQCGFHFTAGDTSEVLTIYLQVFKHWLQTLHLHGGCRRSVALLRPRLLMLGGLVCALHEELSLMQLVLQGYTVLELGKVVIGATDSLLQHELLVVQLLLIELRSLIVVQVLLEVVWLLRLVGAGRMLLSDEVVHFCRTRCC